MGRRENRCRIWLWWFRLFPRERSAAVCFTTVIMIAIGEGKDARINNVWKKTPPIKDERDAKHYPACCLRLNDLKAHEAMTTLDSISAGRGQPASGGMR
jgi:hypothetical protein